MANDKEKNKGLVCCINCKHGSYRQWYQNPIICLCALKDDEKFVAATKRLCPLYEERPSEPVVTHFDHY